MFVDLYYPASLFIWRTNAERAKGTKGTKYAKYAQRVQRVNKKSTIKINQTTKMNLNWI